MRMSILKGNTPFMLMAQIGALLGFAAYAVTLTTLQNEWRLSNFESGLIASAFFVGYIVVVPFATALTDQMDARRIYIFGSILAIAGQLGMGFLANGFYTACACMMLSGAGLAATYMPGLKILSDRVTQGEITRHISFYTAFFGVGTGLSYVISGWILNWGDWQSVYRWVALGPAVSLLIVYFLVRPMQSSHWDDCMRIQWTDIFPIRKWQQVLQNRNASGYILGYTVHSLELFASRSWLVAFFILSTQLSGEQFFLAATTLAGLINFFGVPASILGNELALKLGRQRWIAIVMVTSALFGVALAYSMGHASWIILALAIGHAIFIMADSATLTAGLVTSADEKLKGAAMGLHSLMGFGGGLLGPAIFGFVLDLTGSQSDRTSWIWAYASIVIWGVLFVIYERRKAWVR
jgi:MFS family permease